MRRGSGRPPTSEAFEGPYPPQTPHVFQTGVEMDETWADTGILTSGYYVWREYTEAGQVDEMTTSAGHDIYCQVIKYFSNNRAAGEFWCKDVSTGQVAVYSEYVDNQMVNNTAEWILERPYFTSDNSYGELSNYGTAQMRNAWIQTTTGVWFTYAQIYPHWSIYQIIMQNSSNQTLSFASPDGTYNIDWQYRQSF